MFLWIGCKLPEEFEKEIRQRCLELNKDIGLNTVAFELPQHISLKISFQTDRAEEVLEDLAAYLAGQTAFSVRITGAEQNGNILWMPVEESEVLRRLHNELDERLEQRFGIRQHPFDKCFLFHSTLFMDEDTGKIEQMAQLLSHVSLPNALPISTFLLGQSETGKPGTCQIVREIIVGA